MKIFNLKVISLYEMESVTNSGVIEYSMENNKRKIIELKRQRIDGWVYEYEEQYTWNIKNVYYFKFENSHYHLKPKNWYNKQKMIFMYRKHWMQQKENIKWLIGGVFGGVFGGIILPIIIKLLF